MTISQDGSGSGHGRASTIALSITTTNANDIVAIVVFTESTTVRTITSITDASLTWHKAGAGTMVNGSYTLNFEIWWAFAASALSSHSATVNLSGTPDGYCWGWTGITGLYTAAPVDPNAAAFASGATNCTLTTSNLHDFLLFASGDNSGTTNQGSAPSGFTSLANFVLEGSGANWCTLSFSYKIVSAVQTGVTITPTSASAPYLTAVAAFTADGPPANACPQTAVTVICG